MGAVMVRCPETGRDIPTGLVTDRKSFDATPVFFARVYCPICRSEHEWFAKEAWVCEAEPRPRHGHGAAAVGLFVDLCLELPAGAAGAGAMGTASLRHEALDDAVKRDAIVEALAHQFLDACDMAGGEVRPHQNDDLALGGLQRQ